MKLIGDNRQRSDLMRIRNSDGSINENYRAFVKADIYLQATSDSSEPVVEMFLNSIEIVEVD